MFTQGTKDFGIWRVGHPSVSRHFGRPTQAILLAYGFCAFLTWFIFILTLKVRGEFFLIEGLNIPLHKVAAAAAPAGDYPRPSMVMAVQSDAHNKSLRIVFDSGHVVKFPEEAAELEKYLSARVNDIELTALLSKRISAGLGTAELWVDASVPLGAVNPIAKALVRAGFEKLRYAVEAARPPLDGVLR